MIASDLLKKDKIERQRDKGKIIGNLKVCVKSLVWSYVPISELSVLLVFENSILLQNFIFLFLFFSLCFEGGEIESPGFNWRVRKSWLIPIPTTKKIDISVNGLYLMRGVSPKCYLSFPLLEMVDLTLGNLLIWVDFEIFMFFWLVFGLFEAMHVFKGLWSVF